MPSQLVHHWWGPLPPRAAQPLERLGYITARRRIFLPSYHWVLQNRAAHIVRELAQLATAKPVVLVDFFVNGAVENTSTPLSHAAVLKRYLENNRERLLER